MIACASSCAYLDTLIATNSAPPELDFGFDYSLPLLQHLYSTCSPTRLVYSKRFVFLGLFPPNFSLSLVFFHILHLYANIHCE